MLFGGIRIPEALLTAHEERRLVIFTGAGISMGPPSNLPNFLGLAEMVATKLQSAEDPNSEAWKPQLDAFLGKLDDEAKYDVHRLVRGIVTASTSTPNANHDALARIAATGTARVVTTNYDLHLERTLAARCGTALEVFRAPALPLGDDFEGLVYLHGSGETEPERLVVTDRDFSKAYFHAAWAARFLERMFSQYVVLFVGYSHSDVVMKYLGLGLGPRAERYVITDDPNNEIWDRLRVKVLDYPARQHDVVTKCLTEWADHGEMGLLEHRQRIRTIVSGASPTPEQNVDLITPPAELSYLQDAVRRPDRVGFFCDYATDPGWLEWVRNAEPFRALFDRTHQSNEASSRLAHWFAKTFAYGDEEVSARAWTALAEAGGTLGTILWSALAVELHRYRGVRPPHVLRWIWLLLEQEHAGCLTDYLDYALEWDGVWADRELSLAVLEHLMAPQLKPERTWGTAGLAVDTRGSLHWLDTSWADKFVPELDAIVSEVFPVVDSALTRHLILEQQATDRRLGFSWHRPAIQPNPQDQAHHREAIDAVIDAARDCIERLWITNPNYAQQVIDRWAASDHPLLKRLAVHGISVSPILDGDARVRFVLDNGLATGRDTPQEVFHLLESAGATLSTAVVDELLVAYAPASDDIRDQWTAYTAYELLERSGVVSERLSEALASIRALHDFTPDEYPRTTGAPVFRWAEDKPPLSTEEFAEKVQENPAAAVQFILGFEARVVPRGTEPTREAAVTMLRRTVQQYPSVGLDLWPHLGSDEELRGTVISAWGHTTDPEEMTTVLAILLNTDLAAHDHQVGQFLLHAAQSKDVRWDDVPGVDAFIDAVWSACETSETYAAGEFDDWYAVTINEPVGHLLEFWFRVFHHRWTAAGDDWDGLSERDRTFLDRALTDPTRRGAHALTEISSRLAYLDQADSTWCRRQLLPLKDWANPVVAEPFWWGVLSHGRWNSGLAADGLLDGLIETATHLEAFTDDERRRWAAFLASIAVRCETPAAEAWIDKFTALTSLEDRERWIDSLADELEALNEAGRAVTWANWLRSYWHRRTLDDPIVFERSEMDRFASIAPQAPATEFENAVVLVETTSAGFDEHADASRHVTDGLIDAQPEAAGRYYTHLMKNTPLPFYGSYEVQPKLELIVAKPGNWDGLKAAAFRLGIDLT